MQNFPVNASEVIWVGGIYALNKLNEHTAEHFSFFIVLYKLVWLIIKKL